MCLSKKNRNLRVNPAWVSLSYFENNVKVIRDFKKNIKCLFLGEAYGIIGLVGDSECFIYIPFYDEDGNIMLDKIKFLDGNNLFSKV